MSKLGGIEKMIMSIDMKFDNSCKKSDVQIETMKNSWADVANESTCHKHEACPTSININKWNSFSRVRKKACCMVPWTKTAMEDVEEMVKKELFKNFDKPISAFRLGSKYEKSPYQAQDQRRNWDMEIPEKS